MTDKQIIIDGCDVSECDCYYDEKCLCEYNEIDRKIIRYYSCNKFPNCNYKQLKRAEQRIVELNKTIKSKEQECERLKEEIKTKTYHWEECTEEILKGTKHFVDRMEKAEKTLTEIKEIAEKLKNFYEELGKCEDLTVVRLKQILQKISEVENEKV